MIAGDFLYIKKYSPEDLDGKIILTNTTTKEDMVTLEKRGVKAIITTTPRLDGRSFGTNLFEAALVAYAGKNRELTFNYLLKFSPYNAIRLLIFRSKSI